MEGVLRQERITPTPFLKLHLIDTERRRRRRGRGRARGRRRELNVPQGDEVGPSSNYLTLLRVCLLCGRWSLSGSPERGPLRCVKSAGVRSMGREDHWNVSMTGSSRRENTAPLCSSGIESLSTATPGMHSAHLRPPPLRPVEWRGDFFLGSQVRQNL